jgi:membrane-associated protease RseP (regulator of RpoE activity)
MDGPAPAPSDAAARIRSLLRHARPVLFAMTAFTTLLAGSWFWEENGERRDPFSLDQLRPDVLVDGLVYAISLLAILGAHEMGHYLACRRYGIPATLPLFVPGFPPVGTFGAVIRIRGPIPNRRALFDVAAAGPLAGFAVALPVMCAGLASATPTLAEPMSGALILGPPILSVLLGSVFHASASLDVGSLYGAGWVGMLVTSMNLFPVGQLDGGHVVYALSRRLHKIVAWATIAALAVFVAAQAVLLGGVPAYALWFVVTLFLRDRHPRLVDEAAPLGSGRALLAVLLAVLFVISFIPVPFLFVP